MYAERLGERCTHAGVETSSSGPSEATSLPVALNDWVGGVLDNDGCSGLSDGSSGKDSESLEELHGDNRELEVLVLCSPGGAFYMFALLNARGALDG